MHQSTSYIKNWHNSDAFSYISWLYTFYSLFFNILKIFLICWFLLTPFFEISQIRCLNEVYSLDCKDFICSNFQDYQMAKVGISDGFSLSSKCIAWFLAQSIELMSWRGKARPSHFIVFSLNQRPIFMIWVISSCDWWRANFFFCFVRLLLSVAGPTWTWALFTCIISK